MQVSKVILRKWGLKAWLLSVQKFYLISVSKVILRKWGLKGKLEVKGAWVWASFKGHTQKMRIESYSPLNSSFIRIGFKGHTQKMRIESPQAFLFSFDQIQFQRSYSENEDWKLCILHWELHCHVFQRSYSENEDWKSAQFYTIKGRPCFKGHTQKMRIERNTLLNFLLSFLFRFKGHTQKMRIERMSWLPWGNLY